MELMCFRKQIGNLTEVCQIKGMERKLGEFGNVGWGQMKWGFVSHGKKSIFYSKDNFFFSVQLESLKYLRRKSSKSLEKNVCKRKTKTVRIKNVRIERLCRK